LLQNIPDAGEGSTQKDEAHAQHASPRACDRC